MEQSGMSLTKLAGDEEFWMSADEVCSIDDLLSKILAGLPLSSLRLFRSVCKRWFSLITDPTFSVLRSRSPNYPCGLLLQLRSGSSEFAYLPLGLERPLIKTLSFPFCSRNSEYIQVWQSCKGFLLCYDHPDKLYVYNPTVNQCKLLPLPRVWKPHRLVKAMALAFDPPHYKILYAREDCRLVHVEIYSSETCTWRSYAQTFPLAFFMAFNEKVVYWHGAIHWLSRTSVFHFSLEDMDNPIQVENHKTLYGVTYGVHDKLLVSRNCLLLVRMLQPPQVDVYEVKDDSYSGWSLKYHVNLEFVRDFSSEPDDDIKVLAMVLGDREEDSFLVVEVTGVMVMQYNIMSKTFRQLCDLTRILLRRTEFCSFLFTPSLVGL